MIPDSYRSRTGSGDKDEGPGKILEKDRDKIIKNIMDRRNKAPAP